MKTKNTATLLFFLLVGLTATAQTIRIADNNINAPAGANIFTGASALQNAITAALTNDIVYIQPSTTSYGDATVGKKITIKGVGFGITEIAPRTSTLGTLSISNSFDGVANVSGLTLTGFYFTTIQFVAGTGGSQYNNIVVENVSGGNFQHFSCLPAVINLVIRKSFIGNIGLGSCSGLYDTKIYDNVVGFINIYNNVNPVISNNLWFRNSSYAIATSLPDGTRASTGVRVEHNIFSGSGAAFSSLFNGLVVNNIFYGTTPNGASPFYSNTFSNNLILSAYTFPVPAIGGPANSDIGNITGIGPLFTNAPVVTSYNATYNYTLQAGSVCINAATTGENIGPSGGLYPWTGNLSLKASAIPIITLFGNSGLVPQNQPLKSNIKAKSN